LTSRPSAVCHTTRRLPHLFTKEKIVEVPRSVKTLIAAAHTSMQPFCRWSMSSPSRTCGIASLAVHRARRADWGAHQCPTYRLALKDESSLRMPHHQRAEGRPLNDGCRLTCEIRPVDLPHHRFSPKHCRYSTYQTGSR
jgi:hypothetical protein